MKKKYIASFAVLFAGVISFSVMLSAETPLETKSSQIPKQVESNLQLETKTIFQLDKISITNQDVENFKAYQQIGDSSLTDKEIIEQLATEQIYLSVAQQKNVAATLEEGKQEALKNREILKTQPQNIQNTQLKLIKLMGLDEEEYWNDFAPKEYQKILTAQNLTKLLLEENILKYNSNQPQEFGKELKAYKHNLYVQALKKANVLPE
ncbi:hypothetical protein [Paenibacillus sp. FSL H3-0469]|uniref:hypothetical protein n=2 Tax=unclassified Paenibacillus TaxID=185978 RepID=UPI0031011E66